VRAPALSRSVWLAASAAAAGLGIALSQLPVAAIADVRANGDGVAPLGPPTGMQATDPADPPTTRGAAIAAVARAQVGRDLDGPNTIDGRDFLDSSALPDAWCAEFAAWAWATQGVPIDGLNGWAGSFLSYGVAHGTYHATGPRVGDAVIFALSPGTAAAAASGTLGRTTAISHVGIVVAVSATTVTIVNGDWGDGRGGVRLVRISTNSLAQSDAGELAPGMRQYVAGYVDPVGL
jgi:hypothetical protein